MRPSGLILDSTYTSYRLDLGLVMHSFGPKSLIAILVASEFYSNISNKVYSAYRRLDQRTSEISTLFPEDKRSSLSRKYRVE